MAPKKPAMKTPTRRSARVASREASKEPSVELAVAAPPPPPAPTAAKQEAAPSNDVIIRDIQAQIAGKNGARLALKFIQKLTREQCEAAIMGLAKQATDLREENENLADENGGLAAEVADLRQRARPSIRRDAFLKKIESFAQQEQGSIPEPAGEENIPAGPAATTTSLLPPAAGAVAAAQSPPQQESGEKRLSAVAAAPIRAVAVEITPSRSAQPSPWREILGSLKGYIPGLRKRKAADEVTTPDSTPKRARVAEPEITPINRPSPRSGLMRSAKNPEVPTSLSTITEYSEPPTTMDDSTPTAPNTTPSKPTRITSRQATSVPPKRRSAAAAMQARLNNQFSTPPPRPYAWERNAAKPKPKEPNADARLAKLQQLQELEAKAKQAQQEADELKAEMNRMKQDADIREIEAHSVHRRKRVKVDHLKVIPHNRPGDSSSTFRVPEIDSDDEMSVDEDVEEDSNVFEELEKRYEQAQATPVQTPMPTAAPASMPPIAQAPRAVEQPPTFMFPNVGNKPDNYHVSEEFKEAAGDLFAQGFEQYIST